MALQEESLVSEAEDWVGEVDLVGEVDSSLPMLIPIGIPISKLGDSIDEIYRQGRGLDCALGFFPRGSININSRDRKILFYF